MWEFTVAFEHTAGFCLFGEPGDCILLCSVSFPLCWYIVQRERMTIKLTVQR